MADVNFNELFGSFSAADALAATETKKNTNFSSEGLYKPSIKDEKCTDMNYRALVRFIPFYHEGKWRTTVSRWECYLKDVNGVRKYVFTWLGHVCKMNNKKNGFSKLYESEIQRLRVEKPEYDDEDDEDMMMDVFGSGEEYDGDVL